MSSSEQNGEERIQYSNQLELMLTLVGYAVGLGNIWRFPYLAFTYGGGAFLIPYFIALFLLGLPLFKLELGLGQMLRQGTLGVWTKLGLPRLRGVGAAATACTFFVSLYYNVIIAWTLYYLGSTLGALFSGDPLPWAAMGVHGTEACPESTLIVRADLVDSPFIVDAVTGFFNKSHSADFWCPEHGAPGAGLAVPDGYATLLTRASECPGEAAVRFWQSTALQQSSGLDDLGGINPGMFAAFTLAWVLIYFCIFNGVQTSGKVVYVTATLPYIALIVFFFRAVTLPNAGQGVQFFLEPKFDLLLNGQVWMRAVTQIFYSLGVGFGSLIAFSSYGSKHSNFVKDATKVAAINCGTSVFAGFVVFPILGYLAHELSQINPCIHPDDLSGLASVGLSGTGLAFIAFPIAIARMPGGFFWAFLFFFMLLCLGIDSQFAMVESVITVLDDAGIGRSLKRPVMAGIVCVISYLCGLIFVTRGGIYWFELFDNYSCVVAMFFVCAMECGGLMWFSAPTWPSFKARVADWTGVNLGWGSVATWKYACPVLIVAMLVLSVDTWDVMDAKSSKRFPEGTGYYPEWSIWIGWGMALLPLLVAIPFMILPSDGVAGEMCSASSSSGEKATPAKLEEPSGAEEGSKVPASQVATPSPAENAEEGTAVV